MNYRIYITQSTNRHIVKRLDSNITPALYDGVNYGLFGEEGRLDFPTGIASNDDYIFICDYKNDRIIKFDKDLNFLSEYLCNSYKPYLIFYDANYTNDLYILGVVVNRSSIKIERLSINLVSNKISDYIGTLHDGLMPTGFCKSSNSTDILVTGCNNDILISTETYSTFTSLVNMTISGQIPQRYMGIVNSGNNIFLNDGTRIIKTDSTDYSNIICIGKSNVVSKTTSILKDAVNGTMFIVDEDLLRILRYDQNLNFVSEVYKHTGSTIALDANSIADFIEFDIS